MFAKSLTLAKTDIERAFAHDEFVVLLQPQIDVADGTIVAAEAFVRWRHPDFGMMTPQLFLPFIEANGAGPRLLDVVVRRGIAAAEAFADAGRNWRVSLNLGASELETGVAAEIVMAALEGHDVAAEDLVLEAPEAALASGNPTVREQLHALRLLGCGLALDSGAALPLEAGEAAGDLVHEIKIGGAAILRFAEIARKVDGGRIARRLAFAKKRGLRSVAVGVENEKTLGALVKLGFGSVQGALIAKPGTLDELLAWDGTWAGEPAAQPAVTPAAALRPRSKPHLVVLPAADPEPGAASEPEALVERLPAAMDRPAFANDRAALDVDFDEEGYDDDAAPEAEADPSDDVVADSEELHALEASGSLHSGLIERPKKAASEWVEPVAAFEVFDPEPPETEAVIEPAPVFRPLALRMKVAARKPTWFERLGLDRLLRR